MITKNLLTAAFLLASTTLFAQSVSYNAVENDPLRVRNVGLRFMPFYADFSIGKPKVEDATVNMGWGFDLFADPLPVLNNRIGVSLKYRRSYFGVPEIVEDSNQVRATQFELGGTYDLFGGQKTVSQTLTVGQSAHTTTSISGVSMERSTRFLAHGGIFRTKSPVEVLNGYETTVRAFGFYGGFMIRQAINYEASISGYGYRGKSYRSYFYANVMWAPAIKYDDVVRTSQGVSTVLNTKVEMDSLGGIVNLGGRLGYSMDVQASQGLAYSFIAEIGLRPPFNGVYAYVGASATINLGIGLDRIARKED